MHDPKRQYGSKNKKVYSALAVYNDAAPYYLYGIIDSLEISSSHAVTIVEYKPTQPKNADFHYDDAMQIFAQKICADSIFACDCEAYIYYADTKKRVKLPFQDECASFNHDLIQILGEMRTYKQNGRIPPIQKSQKCNGCSLQDICMPRLKKSKSVEAEIKELMTEIWENY